MDTKSLLIGIVSFMAGGLLVSVAATTFEKDQLQGNSMESMINSLEGVRGEAYDDAFISGMIEHHETAIEMARLSKQQAHYPEIKQISEAIINAQSDEINKMRQWQTDWGFEPDHRSTGH